MKLCGCHTSYHDGASISAEGVLKGKREKQGRNRVRNSDDAVEVGVECRCKGEHIVWGTDDEWFAVLRCKGSEVK